MAEVEAKSRKEARSEVLVVQAARDDARPPAQSVIQVS